MNIYNIPPHLNWITNINVPKYLMFFAEFYDNLKEQDLIDIWQNILPSNGLSNNLNIKQNIIKDIPIQVFSDLKLNHFNQASYETTKETQTLSSDIKTTTLVGGEEFSVETEYYRGEESLRFYTLLDKIDNLQWLFFKVKRKASLYDTEKNNILPPISLYHNWPYDYFSLVESAKIKIKYKN
jgi:hypothetical protein